MSVYQRLRLRLVHPRYFVIGWLAILLATSIIAPAPAQQESNEERNASSSEPAAESNEAKDKELADQYQRQLQYYQEQLQKFTEQQKNFERALADLHRQKKQPDGRPPSMTLELAEFLAGLQGEFNRSHEEKARLDAAKRQMELALQQSKMAAVHHDAVPRAFILKQIKAQEAAEVLQNIYADAPMRIAVDEPRNLLVVLSDPKTFEPVAELIRNLDQPAADTVKKKPETLQLRVVWIGNAREGEDEIHTGSSFGPNVGDALRELGFGEPRILHQTMVSTVVAPNNPGEFNFYVPIGPVTRLTGGGNVHMTDEERYKVYFELGTIQRVGDQYEQDQVDGSVSMPLDHYMIVGTSRH